MRSFVNNIETRILEIFNQKLGFDQKELETKTFAMLEMDELDMIMLAVCLEDEFKIIIDDEKLISIKSFRALVTFIKNELEKEAKETEKTA